MFLLLSQLKHFNRSFLSYALTFIQRTTFLPSCIYSKIVSLLSLSLSLWISTFIRRLWLYRLSRSSRWTSCIFAQAISTEESQIQRRWANSSLTRTIAILRDWWTKKEYWILTMSTRQRSTLLMYKESERDTRSYKESSISNLHRDRYCIIKDVFDNFKTIKNCKKKTCMRFLKWLLNESAIKTVEDTKYLKLNSIHQYWRQFKTLFSRCNEYFINTNAAREIVKMRICRNLIEKLILISTIETRTFEKAIKSWRFQKI
jgi:hypothetical protein